MNPRVGGMVIVGAGQAGLQTAESLRIGGYDGSIVLLGDEAFPPYHRPPLSKAYLLGELSDAQLSIRALAALARKQIDWRPNSAVVRIDRANQTLQLQDGDPLRYAGLCLATGARARPLTVAGAALDNVRRLRSMADAQAIAAVLPQSHRIVVIGGGFIGLEFAAVARRLGKQVVVLEAANRLLARAMTPLLSDFFIGLHRANGVAVELGVGVEALSGADGRVSAVHLHDGRELPADLVIAGIGAVPNGELAQHAGLTCEGGAVLVDDCTRTSDPTIVAAGDCTIRQLAGGDRLRLESVQNAIEQGKSAAASLLGQHRPCPAQPWFWSDQYDVTLQMVGLTAGHDRAVVRGDIAANAFSVCYFTNGRLCAVDSVNRPQDHLAARKLLNAGRSPTPQQAGMSDVALDSPLR
ncbi:NAD(P)/FAD-dependent oxidoreductase [Xanthomonas maliensis]|uniref:NAD(P)/FAD-dependent oxidoreductase n=1 Tax=Xanthomonas maliensis TaxID=1321368 RepID=UPI0003A9B3E8|nr:FAD-dependent oxidoreductase [Xanthomonas maliensis]KAB7771145.1 pyridine nucleotide-disulfide oxidoreductase [Xanthomonas maliensis]